MQELKLTYPYYDIYQLISHIYNSLIWIQSLILCIFGYRKQKKRTFIFGLSATAALFLLLDIYDIVIGAITLLFTIDQKYIVHILDFIHNIFHKKKKDDKDNKENKENM